MRTRKVQSTESASFKLILFKAKILSSRFQKTNISKHLIQISTMNSLSLRIRTKFAIHQYFGMKTFCTSLMNLDLLVSWMFTWRILLFGKSWLIEKSNELKSFIQFQRWSFKLICKFQFIISRKNKRRRIWKDIKDQSLV